MRRVLTLAVSAVLLSSCTNLTAVSTASGQLLTASSSWSSVADDYSASCLRRNQISITSSDCIAEKKAAHDLDIADKALSGYFTALQQVSDTKKFSIDTALGALGKSAGAIPGINQSQVTAVDTLATFVAGLATGAMREKTLGNLINDGAPKAKAVVNVLQQVGVPALKTIYRDEQTATSSTFTEYVQSTGVAFDTSKIACSTGPSTKGLTTGNAFLLAMEYCRRVQGISAKQAALDNYDKSLGNAQATLQQLIDGKDKLKDTDVIKNLLNDASTLRNDVAAMKKAFG